MAPDKARPSRDEAGADLPGRHRKIYHMGEERVNESETDLRSQIPDLKEVNFPSEVQDMRPEIRSGGARILRFEI